jgi:hypothetical protein
MQFKQGKRRAGKRNKREAKSFPVSASEYFRQDIFGHEEQWHTRHPNRELWLRHQIEVLCKKRLGTQLVQFLDELLAKTDDAVSRGLLVRKCHLLKIDHLQSFKEYSDRALILLTQREKLFDKWEGIYILGYYGGKRAIPYLRELLSNENNLLLTQTIERSILRIEENARKKLAKRGF